MIAETAAGTPVGFAEVSIRKAANGCATQPVPFLEGIWVRDADRRQRIGTQIIRHIEIFLAKLGYSRAWIRYPDRQSRVTTRPYRLGVRRNRARRVLPEGPGDAAAGLLRQYRPICAQAADSQYSKWLQSGVPHAIADRPYSPLPRRSHCDPSGHPRPSGAGPGGASHRRIWSRASWRSGASRCIAMSAAPAWSGCCVPAMGRRPSACAPIWTRCRSSRRTISRIAARTMARCTPAAMTATPRCCLARRAIWRRHATSTAR